MTTRTNQSGFSAIEGLLVIVVLVVIGGAGLFVYHTKHDTKELQTAPTDHSSASTYTTSDAESFVSDFYGKYTDTSNPNLNQKQLVQQYGTSNLIATYGNAQGVDPILCAQGTAPTTVTGAVADGSDFDVMVHEAFTTPQSLTVKVTTQGGLKIDSVECK